MVNSFLGGMTGAVIGQAVIEIVVDNSGVEASLTQQQKALAGLAVAGFGTAVVAATSYETALAGVAKTTGLHGEQLDELGSKFRRMATEEIPMSASALAGIGATAAQLGVEVESLDEFTEAVAKLGTATNIVGEQGATDLARFINIMGGSTRDVERLGSALVDLGNNSATTEAEILDMSMRLGAAARQLGLTQAETLGLAAAMSSLGLRSEAGGTAMSRVMLDIFAASKRGEEGVAEFAEVAGMLPGEFLRIVQTEPSRALAAFIGGLGTAEERGLNVIAMLDEMALGDVRVRDALLRLAGAQDTLTASMELGSRAYEENTALQREFELFADTNANKVRILVNNLQDLAITGGDAVAPALTLVVQGLTETVRGFSELPGEVQAVVAVWLTVVTLGPVVQAAFARITTQIVAMRTAAAASQVTMGGLVTMLGPAGVVGVLATLGIATDAILRKTTGHGLIDWLFRDPQSADAAADAVSRVNDELVRLEALGQRVDESLRLRVTTAEIERQAAAFAALRAEMEEEQSGPGVARADVSNRFLQLREDSNAAKASVKALFEELVNAGVPFEQLHLLVLRLDGELAEAATSVIPHYDVQLQAVRQSGADWDAQMIANAKSLVNVQRATEATGDTLEDNEAKILAFAEAAAEAQRRMRGLSAEVIAANFALALMHPPTTEDALLTSGMFGGVVASMRRALELSKAERDLIDALLEAADPTGELRGIEDDGPGGGGGAGGGGTASTPASRRAAALASTADRRTSALVEAFLRGGAGAVSALRAEFAGIDREFDALVPGLKALGVEVPEEFREMFERIKREAEDGTHDVGNLLGFLVSQTLGNLLDQQLGLRPGDTGPARGAPVQVIEEVNIGLRPDIPGGVDAPAVYDGMRQAWADVN